MTVNGSVDETHYGSIEHNRKRGQSPAIEGSQRLFTADAVSMNGACEGFLARPLRPEMLDGLDQWKILQTIDTGIRVSGIVWSDTIFSQVNAKPAIRKNGILFNR
jgi:hypothetical protein